MPGMQTGRAGPDVREVRDARVSVYGALASTENTSVGLTLRMDDFERDGLGSRAAPPGVDGLERYAVGAGGEPVLAELS